MYFFITFLGKINKQNKFPEMLISVFRKGWQSHSRSGVVIASAFTSLFRLQQIELFLQNILGQEEICYGEDDAYDH